MHTKTANWPCWHQMIVVVNLHKWLNLWPLLDLLLAHSPRHRTGMSFNTSHESMTVGPVSCAIIVVLTISSIDTTAENLCYAKYQTHTRGCNSNMSYYSYKTTSQLVIMLTLRVSMRHLAEYSSDVLMFLIQCFNAVTGWLKGYRGIWPVKYLLQKIPMVVLGRPGFHIVVYFLKSTLVEKLQVVQVFTFLYQLEKSSPSKN